MAYVKSSATETLSHHTRKIAAVVAVLLALVLAVALWYVINPRSFLQLFTSDQTYTELVVAKNVKQAEKDAEPLQAFTRQSRNYKGTATVNLALSDYTIASLGGEDIAGELESYLNSTGVDVSAQTSGQDKSLSLSWKDPSGTLLDMTYLNAENSRYLHFTQLSSYWLKLADKEDAATLTEQAQELLTTGDDSYNKHLTNAATTAFKTLLDQADFRVDKDLTLTAGTKTASGDRINILLDEDDITIFLDKFFTSLLAESTDYTSQEKALQSSLKSLIKKNGVSKVSVDLYVNARNVITGLDFLVKSETKDVSGTLVLQDDSETGFSGSLQVAGSTLLSLEQTRGEAEGSGTLELAFGQLATLVTYDNVSLSEANVLSGHFVTNAFALPAAPDLGNNIVELTLTDTGSGITATGSWGSEDVGTLAVNLSLANQETGVIVPPSEDSISKFDGTALAESASEYFFTTLPDQNESYHKVYKNIINEVYKSMFSQLFTSSK